MKLSLPFEVLFILYQLQEAGFEAFIVGGAVRDIYLHSLSLNKQQEKPASSTLLVFDYDFTTNATPAEIQKIFPQSFYENEYGMVGISHENLIQQIQQKITITSQENLFTLASKQSSKNKIIDLKEAKKIHEALVGDQNNTDKTTHNLVHPFEITTFRSDGIYHDFRRPSQVTWGKSITEDLERRDFSINALAIAVNKDKLKQLFQQKNIDQAQLEITDDDYQLIDQHQGIQDLTAHLIKTVGDPQQRFQEDALRMLRAIRFAVQLNMDIEPQTLAAIKNQAQLIQHISWERIRDEFLKMLISPQAKTALKILDESHLLAFILPELLETKGVQQGGHHTTDVWTHSLDAVDQCPSLDPIVRLATLLHDIGKPQTYKVIDQQITFYNHEIIGSRLANKIGKKFNLSKKELERLFILVRYHMFYYQPQQTDAAIRRLMKKVGLNNIDDILDLREGDRLGSGARKTSWRLEELKQRMIAQLNQPIDVKDLAVNGYDLMTELKLKPGPKLGEILNKLLELVLDQPELNEKTTLLKKAKELV